MEVFKKPWFIVIFFSVVLIVNIFPIGGYSLYILDEVKNATAALEMWNSGEWILPNFNGEPRYDKPPLHYYFFILSYQIFGASAFAARLFPTICGWLTLVLLFRFTKKHFDINAAIFSVSVLLASLHWGIQFRLSVPDPFLILFVTWTLLEVLEFIGSGYQAKSHLRKASFFLGLAVLSKGPIAMVLVGGGIFLFLILEREFFFQRIRQFLDPLAIGLFLIVAIPWYALVAWKTGGDWVYEFIFHHNLNRFADPMEGHGGGFYLTLIMVILGLFPGSLFLPYLFGRFRFWNTIPFEVRFGVLFSAFTLFFFMFSGTKLPNYTVPLYPMLALALGWQMSKSAVSELKWPGLAGAVFLLTFPVAFYFLSLEIPELKSIQSYWWVFVIGALMALIGLVYWWARNYLMNWALMTFGFVLFGFLMMVFLFPKLDEQNPVHQSQTIWKDASSVYFFKEFNPAFPFAMKKVIPDLSDQVAIPSGSLIFTTSKNLSSLDSLNFEYQEVFRQKDLFERTETVILQVD